MSDSKVSILLQYFIVCCGDKDSKAVQQLSADAHFRITENAFTRTLPLKSQGGENNSKAYLFSLSSSLEVFFKKSRYNGARGKKHIV